MNDLGYINVFKMFFFRYFLLNLKKYYFNLTQAFSGLLTDGMGGG